MENGTLIKLIESQSAELAALRALVEQHASETRDGLQAVNWKLDRVVEIVDSLNSREFITDKRLTKLENDLAAVKGDMSAVQIEVAVIKGDVAAIKAKLGA